jgi:hypothetical protein
MSPIVALHAFGLSVLVTSSILIILVFRLIEDLTSPYRPVGIGR